jgi:hypothetical protein
LANNESIDEDVCGYQQIDDGLRTGEKRPIILTVSHADLSAERALLILPYLPRLQ